MAVFQYCSPEDIQNEVRASIAFSNTTSPKLSTVNTWIEQASDKINHWSGRIWGVFQYIEYRDYDYEDFILLKRAPVIAISSIMYNTNPIGSEQGEAWETKEEDTHYTLYDEQGRVDLIKTRFNPIAGKKRFKITYLAGFTTTPGYITELCTKLVTDRLLSSLLNNRLDEGNDGGSISVGSISIVEPGAYGVSNYKRLQDDIKELKQQVTKESGVWRYGNK
jgi:hypothetical protein